VDNGGAWWKDWLPLLGPLIGALVGGLGGRLLTFDGPATQGGGMKPGEEYFSFGGNLGSLFVTAVPADGGFRVRFEAIVAR